ncbi:NAD nucleotidase [Leptotrichia buccalis]|uniref:NAD pyrophosphatase/5'-nucleotidase NadN n=1 Tax=Leptotrichia buccalis (strain ATCC 14201 / DSM 1135 / JCM 12969 / NCTC 10249 / C-1013-b) TaxID=523794 RepID=C7NCI1_LEPBD|nr:NAD nucleotidase [Leptotrichia buccalis]ACV39827.1 NAD pyrophosphatase/5'-nucleotidase NadN [Leptotrichia buccalis C-1013-b]
MKKLLLLGLAVSLFSAVGLEAKTVKKGNKGSTASTFELNVAHINDHHSHLEEEKMPLKLNGQTVTATIGGLPRVAQEIKDFRKNNKNTLVLHAGDAVTGTLYYTLFEGKADAELMNVINFDAFTLGNHEFDDGNKVLKSFLDALTIPIVSSNVVPDKGSILEGKWKPYLIKNVGGQKIGIIGIDVVKKTKESSNPGDDVKFLDEVETARKYVKKLQDEGINKIIVLSHAGYEKNVEIGEKVDGVDLIISGDTHYLLGKEFEQFGLVPEKPDYPKKVNSPDGNPVYIAEAWNYSYLLGEMKAKFDKNGVIKELIPTPKVLIGDTFEIKNAEGKVVQLGEKEKAVIINSIKNNKNIKVVKNDTVTEKLLERYQKEKTELGKKSVGKITEEILGGSDNRVPGPHNKDGSFATTLVAESVLHKLRNMGTGNVDFVIVNAGNVRITLNPGNFTYDQAYSLLPFTSNTVFITDITGAEVKQVLEDAIDYVLNGGSTGAFPYGAGIRYEATKEGNLGTRVKKIEVFDFKANKWVPIDAKKSYMLAVNSYIAQGKDGYTTLGKITAQKRGTDTHLSDTKIFIDYLKEKKEVGRPKSTNVIFKY